MQRTLHLEIYSRMQQATVLDNIEDQPLDRTTKSDSGIGEGGELPVKMMFRKSPNHQMYGRENNALQTLLLSPSTRLN